MYYHDHICTIPVNTDAIPVTFSFVVENKLRGCLRPRFRFFPKLEKKVVFDLEKNQTKMFENTTTEEEKAETRKILFQIFINKRKRVYGLLKDDEDDEDDEDEKKIKVNSKGKAKRKPKVKVKVESNHNKCYSIEEEDEN
jgi:hypothetical protein